MARERSQLFTIPTYDAIFKFILSQDTIRPSFFKTFLPDVHIESSIRLDDHMNVLKEFQVIRDFLHKQETIETVSSLKQASSFVVHIENQKKMIVSEAGTQFLREVLQQFADLKMAFPKPLYDGTMDFVCKLDTGEYTLVEMQVIPYDSWDQRALAYVAAFYGNQLRRGGDWKDIKKVIGINILGGGKDQVSHWHKTPDQFVRHYKMTEQLHEEKQVMDGIEIIQYSIMNAPKKIENQETRDWLTFFQKAHLMTEEDVKEQIKTPAVLLAFEKAKYDKLPEEVRSLYELQDKDYARMSEYTKTKQEEAREETQKQMIRQIFKNGFAIEDISKMTGVSLDDVRSMLSD